MMNNQSLLYYIPGNCTRLDFLSFNVFSDASSFRKGRPWVLGHGEFIIFHKGGKMMCVRGSYCWGRALSPCFRTWLYQGLLWGITETKWWGGGEKKNVWTPQAVTKLTQLSSKPRPQITWWPQAPIFSGATVTEGNPLEDLMGTELKVIGKLRRQFKQESACKPSTRMGVCILWNHTKARYCSSSPEESQTLELWDQPV